MLVDMLVHTMINLKRMQEHFEAILFSVMRTRSFGDEYVHRYKMVTKFFQQRRPLIVLICGVPCTGADHQTPCALTHGKFAEYLSFRPW